MSSHEFRVSFRFDSEREIRYLPRLPEVGDHVTHGSDLWFISVVDESLHEALVTCEAPPHALNA